MTFYVTSPNFDVLSMIIIFLLAKNHRENILKRTIPAPFYFLLVDLCQNFNKKVSWGSAFAFKKVKMMKIVNINGKRRETNHHLNLLQALPSKAITVIKSLVQRLDFTATGYAVPKNDSTKAQSALSNITDGCQQIYAKLA